MKKMNEHIKKYYKIIPLLLVSATLMSCFCLVSFAGTHLGLAEAVKSRVQQLKEEKEKKEQESIAITISSDEDEINQVPVISSLTANSIRISVTASTLITCSASDPDNDPLAYSWSVATDTSGNIYVTGYTFGDLDGQTNQGSGDIFLIKYDPTGTRLWTKQLGTSVDDAGLGVVTDPSGNIYITGMTMGDLDGNINQGGYDTFLMKFVP